MINTTLEVDVKISDKAECICMENKMEELNCSEKYVKKEFSNIEKKLHRDDYSTGPLLSYNKNLEDIKMEQNYFLQNFNIDHTKVSLFLKGIYEKQKTIDFHNITEIQKYSILTRDEYRSRNSCPFCQEGCGHIDIESSCTRKLLTLKNNISEKEIYISNMELHIIIYHNFISERVFSILFDILDIDEICLYVEPEYEFIKKWTFNGNDHDLEYNEKLFNEYFSKVTFKKIVFENGCIGYILPTNYNRYTIVEHYKHLLGIIKNQNNLPYNIDMENLYNNNRNIRIQIDYLFAQQNWTTLSKFTFDLKIVKEFEKTKNKERFSEISVNFDISKFYEQLRNDLEILNEKNYMKNLYSKNLIMIVILQDKQSKWHRDLIIKYKEMRSKYPNIEEFIKNTINFETFKSTVDNIEFNMDTIITNIGTIITYVNMEYKFIKL